jgi:hypothetical protein
MDLLHYEIKTDMENNFEKKMESLETPDTGFVKHQEIMKIGFMNARKSARFGIIFILVPVVFVVLVYIKISLLIKFNFFENLGQFISKFDHHWMYPLIILGLPLLAIIVNLLAVTHFYIDKSNKEFVITIRYQLKNLIVIIISALIIIALFFYIIFLR